MTINLIPSALQPLIQQGALERRWQDNLSAKLGFRSVADRETFAAGIGETITKTRNGLRLAATTPLSVANSASLSSGMTPSTFGIEQYTLGLNMWGDQAESNLVTEGVAILSKFKKDFDTLGEQANRTVDSIARDKLFDAYMGGNTRLTANASSTTVTVDDTRGFAAGQAVKVGSTTYTVATNGVTANTSASSNTFNAKPGTITFTASVTATTGAAVTAETAALVIRAGSKATAGDLVDADVLTTSMIIKAVAQHRANGIPTIDGFYNLYIDPIQASALLEDQKFLTAFTGGHDSKEFKNGSVSEVYGVRLIVQNMSPVDATGVRRAVLVGQGALIESVFTANGYRNAAANGGSGVSHVTLANDIAHIIRAPLDAAGMWVTQSWIYIGGFCVPTDIGTNSLVIPTASGRSLKRAIILESK